MTKDEIRALMDDCPGQICFGCALYVHNPEVHRSECAAHIHNPWLDASVIPKRLQPHFEEAVDKAWRKLADPLHVALQDAKEAADEEDEKT